MHTKRNKLISSRKTQIAIEFCFRRKLKGRDVFWVHGGSDEAFWVSFREIAELVHILPPVEDHLTLLNAVKEWFESPASGNWTIVIDSLDDINLATRLHIPAGHGEILYTTRDERIPGHPGLVSAGAGIGVPKMGEEEAMATFHRIVHSEDRAGRPATIVLPTLLDGLPLAIAQAAAYIRTTHMPTANYLALFQRSEERQQALLSEPLPAALRNDNIDLSRALMTTWQLTVQKIEEESPLSIKLLRIISFLDPDNLPVSFIEAALSAETKNHFKQLEPLLNFGLLARKGSNYCLHRLVSMWTREKMSSEVKRQCIDRAIVSMNICFPPESSDNVTKYMEMLPNALSILDHMGSDGSKFSSESSWKLQGNLIKFFRKIGQLYSAMHHSELSLAQEMVFEQDESKRHISRARLGSLYYTGDHHAIALGEYKKALDGQEMVLGKGHPDTLRTIHAMARVFQGQGEYGKALEWYQRALDGQEIVLGKNHPKTLKTVSNMASVYQDTEEYGKALEWYQRALDGQERVLGAGHIRTLATVYNIASVLQEKEEYDRALELYQRTLDGRGMALRTDHPDTLATVYNMASIFKHKGEYSKALEWYQRALDGREIVLGKGHYQTLAIVNQMAVVFQDRGECEKAMEWHQRAIDGLEIALGKTHPNTLAAVNDMATVFLQKGEHKKALEWYQRALDGWEMVLGEDHPSTLVAVNNIGLVFQGMGEHDKALEWYQRALDGWEIALGKEDPVVLAAVNNMALVFLHKGERDTAMEWHQRALDGWEIGLG